VISPIVLGIGAFLVCLAATYRLGYSNGGRDMAQLYTQYPPRQHLPGCLCIRGAMVDNPSCPHHGEHAPGVS
jgi:hypothetical protein